MQDNFKEKALKAIKELSELVFACIPDEIREYQGSLKAPVIASIKELEKEVKEHE